jgi:hypothetical protein
MSAVLAPSGAATSTSSPASRSLEQKVCTALLSLTTAQLAEALGKDDTGTASRIRSGERSCSWQAWIKLMNFIGYKLVPRDHLCTTPHEMQMLRDGYAFICSSPEAQAAFSRWRELQETRTLDWTQ